MPGPRDPDDRTDALPATEAARVRHRDRKRRTTMVVDNAGVKRIVLARRQRTARAGQSSTRHRPDEGIRARARP